MCGICGKVNYSGVVTHGLIYGMCRAMSHRGPDSEGVAIEDNVGLGHRRLAIIDTSDAGLQPMWDHSHRYIVVFNGEIYNFIELRNELLACGAKFVGRTDTEVLLESYKFWGISCLERFNGMFTFALWDTQAKELLLARDRFGKKPLFWAETQDGGVVFGSCLRSLLCDPALRVTISPDALGRYLSFNYVSGDGSLLDPVRKLPPASFLILRPGGGRRTGRYYDLSRSFHAKRRFASEAEAAEELAVLLRDSVRCRMISDVPLGAFLSGGVDSSAIVSAMCGVRSAHEVQTFSIGFREKSYDELPMARRVAKHLGVHHREAYVEADLLHGLQDLVLFGDDPLADSSLLPTHHLCGFARRHVTVALSGDGGDETFAGYETYVADRLSRGLAWLPGWTFAMMSRAMDSLVPASHAKVSLDYKIRHFLRGHDKQHWRSHAAWRRIFTREEQRRILRQPWRDAALASRPEEDFARLDSEVAGCHFLDRAMYMDLRTWLLDDILVKVDRASMAHGLEARAPFLDYRLVEFAASLPVEMKLKGLRKKYLLRRMLRGSIPREAIDQPKKGFNAPVAHWVADWLEKLVKCGPQGLFGDVVDHSELMRLLEEHRARKRDNGHKLFGLLMLHIWLNDMSGRIAA